MRAAAPLAAGIVLGCLRATVMTLREWGAAARSEAECAFSADMLLFNARHGGVGLIASAFGYGNLVALVNDGPVTVIVDSGEKSSGAPASSSADTAARTRATESLIVSSSSGSESSSGEEARAAPKHEP